MIIEDWRDVPADRVAALYEAEGARWLSALGWDLTPSWRIVEEARAAGRLPGLVARHPADGRVAGWTFYLLHEGILQVGTLVGHSAGAVRRLLERILQSPEAALARGFSCFLFPGSSSVQSALERQRFLLTRHLYLSRPLGGDLPPDPALPPDLQARPLSDYHPADLARLFARSYAGRPEARCFAPDARLDQWARYAVQLLESPALGHYLPSASFAIQQKDTHRPVGAIVTTALSDTTAHVAQVVVDPECQRSGAGRVLLARACERAREAGFLRMTLLVAEHNQPAGTLYARSGFEPVTHFLFASRPTLARRVSAPALKPVTAPAQG